MTNYAGLILSKYLIIGFQKGYCVKGLKTRHFWAIFCQDLTNKKGGPSLPNARKVGSSNEVLSYIITFNAIRQK
jgi:hypothetical protein